MLPRRVMRPCELRRKRLLSKNTLGALVQVLSSGRASTTLVRDALSFREARTNVGASVPGHTETLKILLTQE